jgi:hypothetical protein
MATITQISNAIKTIISALPDVDEASIDGYLPGVTTQKVALVMPPLGLSGTVEAPVGRKTRLVHRIPCEFWVRVDGGNPAAAMQRGREICLNAAAELQASLTLNGTVTFLGDDNSPPFAWAVDPEIFEIGKGRFIRGVLTVTVTVWVTLQA